MSLKRIVIVCSAFACFTGALAAQSQDTVAKPPRFLSGLLNHQLHPIAKGVASGGGPGLGLGYDVPVTKPWEADIDALATIKKYWSVTASAGYHTARFEAEGYARTRDMLSLSYFGTGNATDNDDRSDYRLRDKVAGGQVGFDVAPWLRLNGRVERYWPDVFSGRDSRYPNLEDKYTANMPAGFTQQPTFWRYQTYGEIYLKPGEGESIQQGTRLRATYTYNKDNDLDQFSFTATDLEFQQKFAVLFPRNRLTLHALASSATPSAGQTVPFYMMRTLGGKGYLRSVHDYIIGTDGTDATLRGYSSYRFRDRNLLLLQSEYRFPVRRRVEATLFVDAGRVTPERSDLLKVTGLHSDVGFSLSYMRGLATLIRTDIAFGRDGARALLTLGKDASR